MNLKGVTRRVRRWVYHPAEYPRGLNAPPAGPPLDWNAENEQRIAMLRARGVKIGRDCVIFTTEFSTEPYLVEIGDHVAVSGGTQFLTHDGSAWLMRPRRPQVQHFGRITVGGDTFIAQNCIILPGTRIGSNCVIGAGSVVRATVPDNSVVVGNPGRVVGRTSLFLAMLDASPDSFDSFDMPGPEKEAMLRAHFGSA